jgi:hypothetical protein
MRGYSVLIAAILLIALGSRARAQQEPAAPAVPAEDRSPYLGNPIAHPESLSGLWEAPNGSGGAVGIHLSMWTTILGDATTLRGLEQSWRHLDVGVYERKVATSEFGDENNFSDSSRGGHVRYENGRLTLSFAARAASDPSIDLDLLHQPDGSWKGRFHRGEFDSEVTLRRPSPEAGTETNPVVGTWRQDQGSIFSCVHIAQQSGTEYTGWSDALEIPGEMYKCAKNIPQPAEVFERYGELIKVNVQNGGKITLELYAFTGMCCSHSFIGRLSADETAIEGAWPPGPNQAPRDDVWRKMPDDSCTATEPMPTSKPPAKPEP